MPAQLVPVGILAAYVRDVLERDPILADIWVEGEVSNVFRAQSGHVYFTLKDSDAQLKCVLFKAQAARQLSLPESGQQTAVHGNISLYPRDGAIQLYADVIQPAGVGLLALQFEQLRQRLEADGLFDPSRKRALPPRPHAIGVVTSPDGAVWHDIQNVLRRRYPLVEVILAPTAVQGDAAPAAMAAALDAIQDVDRVDVVILARGGGSAEDLAAFNDEYVARMVFACRVPIVAGVGHETDWTIVDWVADLRAPTPSAAAELCVPNIADLRLRTEDALDRVTLALNTAISTATIALETRQHRLRRADPTQRLAAERLVLSIRRRRLLQRQSDVMRYRRAGLLAQAGLLRALEPHGVLRRGYAVVCDNITGEPILSSSRINSGDIVTAQFADGSVTAAVVSTAP